MTHFTSFTWALVAVSSAFASPVTKEVSKHTFSIEHHKPTAFQSSSPDVISPHSFSLTRHSGSYKHAYFRSIQSGNHENGIYKHGHKKHGSAPLSLIDGGQSYSAEITFGTQKFQGVIDTGSSDTWLVRNGFTCSDAITGKRETESYCSFGPTYNPDHSSTFERIPNVNTNISYAEGSYLEGFLGYEDVTLGGIKLCTEIGVVDSAAWFGDGISSGLIGLSYPDITTQFAGNVSDDKVGTEIPYNPIFTTMYKEGIVKPVFSLALGRSNTSFEGGVLALGGLPHGVSYDRHSVAKIPIEILLVRGKPWCTPIGCLKTPQIQEYTITVSMVYEDKNDITTHSAPFQAIVDSGTTGIYVSQGLADHYNAQFDPPAIYNASQASYVTDCSAKVPSLSFDIVGKKFTIPPEDLIMAGSDLPEGQCITTIWSGDDGLGDGNDGLYILGDVLLKNVLAVFDLGASEVRLYARD